MSCTRPLPDGETILIAEHDQIFRRLICRLLLSEGYRMVPACSPLEALRTAARHESEIDLLMTEVVLPGLYGWELAELLKLDYPKLKVLFISERVDTEAVALAEPSELVLFKQSFRCEDLIRAVRDVLDGQQLTRK